jgi:hypothetical protein
MTVWGRQWHAASTGLAPGALPGRGDRLLVQGLLLDGPDGAEVGEFHGTLFGLSRPGHDGPGGLATLEQHIFTLDGGSIMGSGIATRDLGLVDEFAVVGGTGRFTGARGTYLARQSHWEFGGDGTAEITFTLLGPYGDDAWPSS